MNDPSAAATSVPFAVAIVVVPDAAIAVPLMLSNAFGVSSAVSLASRLPVSAVLQATMPFSLTAVGVVSFRLSVTVVQALLSVPSLAR